MLVPALAGLAPVIAVGWRTDPFSRQFSLIHILPHVLGAMLFFFCSLAPYSGDYKGAWIFLTVPARSFGPFARGVHALLWIAFIMIPHAILLPLLSWAWGAWHAAPFVGYSAALASIYLALELRLIDGAPFSKQPAAARTVTLLPLMIMGGVCMMFAVGLQHYLLFRSPAMAAATAVVVALGAGFLTRDSLHAFETSIRYNLALVSAESRDLYREIDA